MVIYLDYLGIDFNMTTLSDKDILEAINNKVIKISPFEIAQLQPASYDVRLYSEIIRPTAEIASIRNPPLYIKQNILDGCILLPGEFILGAVNEWIEIDNSIVARIEGKSSLGRLGLSVHITAGFVDPGWSGRLTLEIKNHAPYNIIIIANDLIAQISFHKMLSNSNKLYSGKYQNDISVQGMKVDKSV